jgi:glutamate synthase (ferredoxin)
MIGPELRQYWVANDKEEMPFNRSERAWVYSTAKKQNNTFGFGTSELIYGIGYPILKHSNFPISNDAAYYYNDNRSAIYSAKVIGQSNNRKKPYRPPSIINLSAMSFGSLGYRAVSAINKGCLDSDCFHNTGEGGISEYHNFGADIVWQLGTGYFGARDAQGKFSLDVLVEKMEQYPSIKAIEIKISQGAKPGKGGILPGLKVTDEIAAIRGIPVGKDCISPNYHSEFSTIDEMIDFIEKIAARTGLPVGIKSAVGKMDCWEALSDRMNARPGEGPDFIAIDGGEGGTGAAPLTFADHVSLPFKVGFARVYQEFQRKKLEEKVVWIGSAKLGFPDRAIVGFAMGLDLIYVAREPMMAIGCIQAQRCHDGECPSGVATQNQWLQAGLDVDTKAKRLSNYMKGFRKELLQLAHAAGYEHPCQFIGEDIEFSVGVNKFSTLNEVMGYKATPVPFQRL